MQMSNSRLRRHQPTLLIPPPIIQRRSSGVTGQRVYRIFCRECESILSERGMRATLLLQPRVSLFSTDAMPINIGFLHDDCMGDSRRTCRCLTENLGCLCCGATVGYHIILPCDRCLGESHGSSDNHRFVFYSKAVEAKERKYVQDELGVRPQTRVLPNYDISPSSSTSTSSSSSPSTTFATSHPALHDYLVESRQKVDYVSSPTSSRLLEEGDQIYWSNLIASGECSRPVDRRRRRKVERKERVGR